MQRGRVFKKYWISIQPLIIGLPRTRVRDRHVILGDLTPTFFFSFQKHLARDVYALYMA